MGIVIRQSFKASLSNYIGIGLGFIGLFFLFPLFFTPEQFGAIRLLIELSAVLSGFALMGTNYSINKYFTYFKNEKNGHNGFFFYALLAPLIGLVIVFTALSIFKSDLLLLFNSRSNLISDDLLPVLVALILTTVGMTIIEVSSANYGRIAKPYFIREVVQRIGIISIAFLYYLDILDFTACAWGIVFVYSFSVGLNFYFFKKLGDFSIKPNKKFYNNNKPLFKGMTRYTAFLFFGGVSSLFINKIDFIMVSHLKSLDYMSIYTIAFYLASFIEIPRRSMAQILTPIISEHIKNENFKELRKLYQRSSITQVFIATVLFFCIWLNLDTFYEIMPKGDFYKQGKYVVLIIGIGKLMELSTGAASPIIATSKFYPVAFISFILGAIIGIGGNLLLIPVYGINGAAAATSLTFLMVSILAISTIKIYYKTSPYVFAHLKLVLIAVPFFIIPTYGSWIDEPILDSILKSAILIPFLLGLLLKFKISADMNNQTLEFIRKFKFLTFLEKPVSWIIS